MNKLLTLPGAHIINAGQLASSRVSWSRFVLWLLIGKVDIPPRLPSFGPVSVCVCARPQLVRPRIDTRRSPSCRRCGWRALHQATTVPSKRRMCFHPATEASPSHSTHSRSRPSPRPSLRSNLLVLAHHHDVCVCVCVSCVSREKRKKRKGWMDSTGEGSGREESSTGNPFGYSTLGAQRRLSLRQSRRPSSTRKRLTATCWAGFEILDHIFLFECFHSSFIIFQL